MAVCERQRILDVEEAIRSVLLFLDFQTLDAMVSALVLDPTGRTYLRDASLWSELTTLHFLGRIPEELVFLSLPRRERSWDWSNSSMACPELQHFLRSGDERENFKNQVHIVRGDIGKITTVNDIRVDGLAFPTNSHLSNHFIGAAAAVFKRAGRGLMELVRDPLFQRRHDVGETVATPAFDAGVKCLIHCVGPRISQDNCFERLSATYENLMHRALAEDLQCVAVASISTGAMSVPVDLGAQVGLRAIQKFIRMNHWEGTVGIVCYEDKVFHAFQVEHAHLLDAFNAVPVLPRVTPEMWG